MPADEARAIIIIIIIIIVVIIIIIFKANTARNNQNS